MSGLMLAAASVAAFTAFSCFALAMPRHWQDATHTTTDTAAHPKILRLLGTLLLGIAYAVCVLRDGPSFGSVLWALLISAAAFATAFLLSWRPHLLLALRHRSRGTPARR